MYDYVSCRTGALPEIAIQRRSSHKFCLLLHYNSAYNTVVMETARTIAVREEPLTDLLAGWKWSQLLSVLLAAHNYCYKALSSLRKSVAVYEQQEMHGWKFSFLPGGNCDWLCVAAYFFLLNTSANIRWETKLYVAVCSSVLPYTCAVDFSHSATLSKAYPAIWSTSLLAQAAFQHIVRSAIGYTSWLARHLPEFYVWFFKIQTGFHYADFAVFQQNKAQVKIYY